MVLAIAVAPQIAAAQDPIRPWLDWRTLETRHYRFHFPNDFQPWARHVAERVESIDSAITAAVGYRSPEPVHVVIDDPFSIANGYALPFIDRPVTVWWATPPDPRNDIGNFRTWGEMLSVHELTHIAHMTRPSRNAFQRRLWSSLPVNLGPITRFAPRWLYEGYATFVEGRITGTGRPNNVWRPALLRQWAIEGRLPSYGQLSASGDYFGGEFAYLNGSAFLEWLAAREGDSSLVHVWRRLTARRVRSTDAAFAGVYGDAPATLYGRHVAEVTRDAMAAKAALERAGLVEGELVQHLMWTTGDPALSPNGARVAIALRERDRPSRVVVWSAALEPEDTTELRRRMAALRRDPLDVPDRRIYPRPRKPLKTLRALNGRSFQQPRWFADNRRVLLSRWLQRADGTSSPGLYVWDTETGTLKRVTAAVGVSQADPHPNGNEAVAMQCRAGHCDVAHVDLNRGATRTLLAGDPDVSYYRPRYSPDGTRFVASMSRNGKWQLVIGSATPSNVAPRLVGPNDGANRYDAQWVTNDSLVLVSERGGIPNLEVLGIESGARALTRVTGAAVAPDVNRADGSIWFLSLHSRGFDVRRVTRAAPRADSVVTIAADAFGFAGVQRAAGVELAERPVGPARSYGAGPRHQRWLPAGYASADGAGASLTIFTGDIIGRLNATATGAFGDAGAVRGGALRAAWRFPRLPLELGAFALRHEPARGPSAQPAADSLSGSLSQALLAFSSDVQGDGWKWRSRAGIGGGTWSPRDAQAHPRVLGFGEIGLQLSQSRAARGLVERVRLHGTAGRTRDDYTRLTGALELATTGRDAIPLELSVTAGRVAGAPHPFELFSVGGGVSPVGDSSLMTQRHTMAMLPTAVVVGNRLIGGRIAFPAAAAGWTPFYEGVATAMNTYTFNNWQRAVGVETRFSFPPVPAAFSPRFDVRGGAAYSLDPPYRKRVRAYLEMRMEP